MHCNLWKTRVLRLVVCAAAVGAARILFQKTEGIATLVCLGVLAIGAVLCLKFLLELLASLAGKEMSLRFLSISALVLGSLLLPAILFEVFLSQVARGRTTAPSGQAGIAMPEEWKKRIVQIPGTRHAFYWHGHLHVLNEDSMRIVGAFPPKPEGTFRVMVVGDSLTYGEGVAEVDTYCRVLERSLGKKYRIEFLNLGRMGDQSEDILKTLKTQLPLLKPDLVVYGVCLNDFLPSQASQYNNNMTWQVKFPGQKHLIERTQIGGFLAKKYDDVLVSSGVRVDFYQDILRDFKGYQQRFGRDVKAMNDFVTANGLPPVVTLVLNQYPGLGQGDEITAIAEKFLSAAGMEVVPSRYIQKYSGKRLNVSDWEGHPNEEAHRVFAHELEPYIANKPGLAKYRHAE